MPSEKHQQKAQELIGRRETTLNHDTLTNAIAAALEATEWETAQKCSGICDRLEIAAYIAAETIRAEFGITEKP